MSTREIPNVTLVEIRDDGAQVYGWPDNSVLTGSLCLRGRDRFPNAEVGMRGRLVYTEVEWAGRFYYSFHPSVLANQEAP